MIITRSATARNCEPEDSVPVAFCGASRFDKLNQFVDEGNDRLATLGCRPAAHLWLILYRFESAATGTVRVGLQALSARYGTDKRYVARLLAQLEEHGYLVTLDPGKPGRGSCALYRLIAAPEKVPGEHLSGPVKGAPRAPIVGATKGAPRAPFESEKVPGEHGKGASQAPVQNVQNKDTLSAGTGGAEKRERKKAGAKTAPKENKPRAPKPLFDAIAEVTGRSPATSASHIAKVEKVLLRESPPYTPDEVRALGRRFWELCPWAARDRRARPELGELQNHISKVRTNPERAPVPPARDRSAPGDYGPMEEPSTVFLPLRPGHRSTTTFAPMEEPHARAG